MTVETSLFWCFCASCPQLGCGTGNCSMKLNSCQYIYSCEHETWKRVWAMKWLACRFLSASVKRICQLPRMSESDADGYTWREFPVAQRKGWIDNETPETPVLNHSRYATQSYGFWKVLSNLGLRLKFWAIFPFFLCPEALSVGLVGLGGNTLRVTSFPTQDVDPITTR